MVSVGSVGTGFKADQAMKLRATMDKMKVSAPAVRYTGHRKNLVWIKPKLVAEIEYRAWTHDGKLRHASYKGLREKEDDAVVYDL
ncbi:hypothetical protein HJB99_26885 [Rhizobium sp. NLR17b]|nr:hypothetical protein [Rhizobium sp. NLR17b]